jgi:hypothetical protein
MEKSLTNDAEDEHIDPELREKKAREQYLKDKAEREKNKKN